MNTIKVCCYSMFYARHTVTVITDTNIKIYNFLFAYSNACIRKGALLNTQYLRVRSSSS